MKSSIPMKMQDDERVISLSQSIDNERNDSHLISPRSSLSCLPYIPVQDLETEKEQLLPKLKNLYKNFRGVCLMLLAQVFSAMMNVSIRLLENTFSQMRPQQILFFRMSITTIAITVYLWQLESPESILGRKENRWLLIARGIGGFLGVFGLYYSLIYLDLGEATVITFLTPILANFISSLLLKTSFSLAEIATGVISLIGVVFIAKPTSFLIQKKIATESLPNGVLNRQNKSDTSGDSELQRLFAIFVALLGVCGSVVCILFTMLAFAYRNQAAFTSMRWMAKPQNPLVAVNYFTACCTIVTFAVLAIPGISGSWDLHIPGNPAEWALLTFSGVCGFIMLQQVLITMALQDQNSSRATNMVYTQIFFALILDMLIFHVIPDFSSLLGIVLIVGSAIYQVFFMSSGK